MTTAIDSPPLQTNVIPKGNPRMKVSQISDAEVASETPEQPRVVMGHDLVNLVASLGGDVEMEQLRSAAAAAFGPNAILADCHGDTFNVDELVAFLAWKGKLEVDGTRVRVGPVAPCSHH